VGLALARDLARSFDVDAVVDTGDITSFGFEPEARFVDELADFEVPYYLVAGNHDSEPVRRRLAESLHVISLEDEAVDIAGAAMENGDEAKGRLVLQRWEAVEDVAESPVTREPANLDLRELDASGVEAAPTEAFEAISEDEAIDVAGEAMEAGDEEKGQLVLQRWDEINDAGTAAEAHDGPASAGSTGSAGGTGAQSQSATEEGTGFDDLFSDTAGGMLGAFADEDRDEDEIGGYMYDIGFILDSMRSRMFLIVAVFIGVFTATFAYLYTVGIKQIMDVFISQVPNEALAPGQRATDATDVIIALHPVEVLIFIVKFSGVVSILVTTPVVLYYAWPALQQRGLAPGSGDRRAFLMWGYVLLMGTLTGAIVGFFGVAPTVLSYLVTDAVESGMVVSYRIKSLLWIVFFMTIGFGFFLNIPVGMLLLHLSDLVYFESMRTYWRHFVLVTFVLAALITPGGILTMLVFAIPVALAYLIGLVLLWLLTTPWRLLGRGRSSST